MYTFTVDDINITKFKSQNGKPRDEGKSYLGSPLYK